jgi:hypothetical protein
MAGEGDPTRRRRNRVYPRVLNLNQVAKYKGTSLIGRRRRERRSRQRGSNLLQGSWPDNGKPRAAAAALKKTARKTRRL